MTDRVSDHVNHVAFEVMNLKRVAILMEGNGRRTGDFRVHLVKGTIKLLGDVHGVINTLQ